MLPANTQTQPSLLPSTPSSVLEIEHRFHLCSFTLTGRRVGWFLHNHLCAMLLFHVAFFPPPLLCLHILSTDVQDKSRCRDNGVYIKSCNIVKYKRGHVSFVCLNMKSVKTRTVIDFSMKHFDQVPNELPLTRL